MVLIAHIQQYQAQKAFQNVMSNTGYLKSKIRGEIRTLDSIVTPKGYKFDKYGRWPITAAHGMAGTLFFVSKNGCTQPSREKHLSR